MPTATGSPPCILHFVRGLRARMGLSGSCSRSLCVLCVTCESASPSRKTIGCDIGVIGYTVLAYVRQATWDKPNLERVSHHQMRVNRNAIQCALLVQLHAVCCLLHELSTKRSHTFHQAYVTALTTSGKSQQEAWLQHQNLTWARWKA